MSKRVSQMSQAWSELHAAWEDLGVAFTGQMCLYTYSTPNRNNQHVHSLVMMGGESMTLVHGFPEGASTRDMTHALRAALASAVMIKAART